MFSTNLGGTSPMIRQLRFILFTLTTPFANHFTSNLLHGVLDIFSNLKIEDK